MTGTRRTVALPDDGADDKPSDTLVVGFGRRFWTGSSTLPHLHQNVDAHDADPARVGVM